MKVYCPISGIAYTTNFGIGSFTQAHPTLGLSIEELTKITEQQLINRSKNNDKVTQQVNTHLVLLSWFLKLPGIQVQTTIDLQTNLHVLIANQEQLIKTVAQVNATKHKINYPGIIVSNDNPLHAQLKNWLEAFNECIRLSTVAINETKRARTARELDEALDKVTNIFLPHSSKKNAGLVADWAAVSGNFPHSVKSLWKDIIFHLFKGNDKELAALAVTQADIDELIEHCEDNIPHGSYHAHELMSKLRETMSIIEKQTGLSSSTTVKSEEVETDEEEPQEEDFETRAEFLRAKANYLSARIKVTKVSKGGIVMDLEL